MVLLLQNAKGGHYLLILKARLTSGLKSMRLAIT